MVSFPRGSEWRKWDLHIHSNASDGHLSPREIIDIAVNAGVSVIALTDHHTVRNVDEAKRIGKECGITVISGVEFRTEFGSKSVHIIGLLPDDYNGIKLDQNAIEHLILDKLGLSRVLIEAKGRENDQNLDDENAFKKGMHEVQVDLRKTADLIHEYGGLISVHAGKKSNSIEEMRHDGNGASNVKDVVDSLGPVKEELLKNYIDICEIGSPNDKNADFYIKEFNVPVITASDAHDKERLGKIFTWIKADPTFEGLRQIKYEPELRVKIQEHNPEMKRDYQVIDSIEIVHPDFGNKTIVFNSDLNTIIGGRSSGKSILLAAIAKLANYRGKVKDKDEYNEYIDSIISSMKLIWKDHAESTTRKVEYFPQTYINGLAAESESTITLIENILKDDSDRKLSFDNYDSELSKNTISISNAVENLVKLQYRLTEIGEEINTTGGLNVIAAEIDKITKQIDDVRKNSNGKMTEEDEKRYSDLKEGKRAFQERIERLQSVEMHLHQLQGQKLVKDISSDFIGLPDEIKDLFGKKLYEITTKVETEWEAFVESIIVDVQKESSMAVTRIAEIDADEKYIYGEKYYKENEALTVLSDTLESERKKEKHLNELVKKQKELLAEILKQKSNIFQMQEEYALLAEQLSEKVSMVKDEITISPQVLFSTDVFMEIIDSNFVKRGTAIKEYTEFTYKDKDQFITLLKTLLDKIENEELTLKAGKNKKQVVLSILSTNYYKLIYNVEYQGDNLNSMSEGKKAFVILRMLLDFDDNECPILIDQPEDDLDNRAIYNDLVSYIRKKKCERQIILVTHNPNIVVTADAEEVIVANQHGIHNENEDGIKFDYCSGAIENSFKNDNKIILYRQGIREHICEILEGGDVAFLKRENKYCLKS